MKSERQIVQGASPRSGKQDATSTSSDERSRDRGKPAWLEPWLEAEESDVYDLPCTD